MAFCTFSNEFNTNASTNIDNKFILSYLPEASGNAVKVYLYGLLLCKSDDAMDAKKFAENLRMDESEVADSFRFWEEWGLINIISEDPFLVKYLPITSSKPKKINVEKYTEFNKALQVLIPERMITTNEYSAYFGIMEDFSISPEAMLMIVKYCVDLKGGNIGFRYILKVANDFAARGLTTVSKIEKELSDYSLRSGDIREITDVVSPSSKPEIEDLNLYKKWTKEMSFDKDTIIFVAKTAKIRSMQKLDRELGVLYSGKKFSVQEIEKYYAEKSKINDLARKITRSLSVYVEVIDPVVETYVVPWLNKGYGNDELLFIADFCFKRNRRSLEDMNDAVNKLYKNGLITLSSIAEYIKGIGKDDEFIKSLLQITGLSRRPTEWDRESLKTWRSWNFSDEMITEAAKISAGKSNPVSYINAVLSGWKSQNVFTPDKIVSFGNVGQNSSSSAIRSRSYSKTELEAIIDNFDSIDL